MTSSGPEIIIKLSSVMPFSFNAIELCVVTINEKPWTRAKEACRALEYGKATKTAHVSPENYAQKYQMSSVPAATTPINWPKYSQKYDIYINEKEMYELVFEVKNQKQKHLESIVAICCFLMFGSSLQTKYRRNINKPSRNVTIKYKPINRKF